MNKNKIPLQNIDFPGTAEFKQKLHTHQKKIAKLFFKAHLFFKQNDYQYIMDAGTLLGAVRNKSFIPWDDDVDILMMKKDFERLKKNVKENDELGKNLGLRFSLSEVDKLYVGISPLGEKRHLIDIYCLERYFCGCVVSFLNRVCGKIIYRLLYLMGSIGFLHNQGGQKNLFLNLAYFKKHIQQSKKLCFLRGFEKTIYPFFFLMSFPLNLFLLGLNFLIRNIFISFFVYGKGRFVTTRNFSSMGSDYGRRAVKHGDIFPLVKIPFEGFYAYAPKNYRVFLRAIYKNYEKLPPYESRKPGHFIFE